MEVPNNALAFRWQGKTSTDNYLLMTSLPTVHQAPMNTEEIFIPGAINHKYADLGYNCFDLSFSVAYIGEETEFAFTNRMNSFLRNPAMNRLEGRLVISNSPEIYYTARLLGQVDFEGLYKYRTATLTFRCQPFKHRTWWNEGEDFSYTDGDLCENWDQFSRETHTVAYEASCRIAPVQNRRPRMLISSTDIPTDAKWMELSISCKPSTQADKAILEQGKKYVTERHYILDVGSLGSITDWEIEVDTETDRWWLSTSSVSVEITSLVNNQDSYPTILGERFFDITSQMVRDRYHETYEQYAYNRPLSLGIGADKIYIAFYNIDGDLLDDESYFNINYWSMTNEL